MAKQRQTDSSRDLESFTVRIPTWLKESLDRIKSSLSISTTSDAARFVMETGAGAVETLGDIRGLLDLEENEQQSLQKIVAKWRHGQQLFSRAELAFVAQWAHCAYLLTGMTNVQRAPILANLHAFAAVRSLRNELYPESDFMRGRDRYYHGNLGNSGGGSIDERIALLTASLKAFPYASQAEFASRCLEVALRDEPPLPVDRLNDLLRPWLPALIKLALRGYLQKKDGVPAFPIPIDMAFAAPMMNHPEPVTRGHIQVSPNINNGSMTAAIIWKHGNVIVSVNGFVEMNELLTLTGAVTDEQQTTGTRFHFLPPRPPFSEHLMRVAGVQIAFGTGEFDDLQHALNELINQPVMKSEYERLSWIFGEI